MERSTENLKIQFMKCKSCLKQKVETLSGICLICKPNIIHGREVVEQRSDIRTIGHGTIIMSKTGKTDENKWMSK